MRLVKIFVDISEFGCWLKGELFDPCVAVKEDMVVGKGPSGSRSMVSY